MANKKKKKNTYDEWLPYEHKSQDKQHNNHHMNAVRGTRTDHINNEEKTESDTGSL